MTDRSEEVMLLNIHEGCLSFRHNYLCRRGRGYV